MSANMEERTGLTGSEKWVLTSFFIFITDSRVQYLQMFNNILLVVTEISIMITCSCREYYTFRSSYSSTSSVVG